MPETYVPDTYDHLREPFPESEVYSRQARGGISLDYIPYVHVVDRLNDVLGFDGWSHEIVDVSEKVVGDQTYIIATVRLHVHKSDGTTAFRDGIGGKCATDKFAKGMLLQDLYKTAVSDALKKAAQAIGVALYLALGTNDDDDDDYGDVSVNTNGTVPQGHVPKEWYDQFVEAASSAPEDVRQKVKARWAELAGVEQTELGLTNMTEDVFQVVVPYMRSLVDQAA